MSSLTKTAGLWGWHLALGNPILVRVVHGASKRPRDLWLRFGYLAGLTVVALVLFVPKLQSAGSSLSDLAKGASSTFEVLAFAQLFMMCFLAPVFTSAAITQEKDSQTYEILLATPLSNAQIVLGSLMSRLYFVLMLLFSGLPIFFITMIYGGVTGPRIFESFIISAATAIFTGSLAIMISMIRVGTRKTIFSFYLMIGSYLLSLYALGQWSQTAVLEAPKNIDGKQMSWLAPFHPFLALDVALNKVPAPESESLVGHSGIAKWALSRPQSAYVAITMLLSVLMTCLSMFFVRAGQKEGESSFLTRLRSRGKPEAQDGRERRRKPRHVWNNPIAWREAVTRASATSRGLVRYLLIAGGAVGALLILIQYAQSGNGFGATQARQWMSVVVMIELGLVLLVSTNTAAMSMTKEREANTLDLILTTPVQSKDLIWGKLRGLVSFTMPLILIPVCSILVFAIYDLFKGNSPPVAHIETGVLIGVMLVLYTAVACLTGMYFSLRRTRTVQAVMFSISVVIVVCMLSTVIGSAMVEGMSGGGGVAGMGFAPIFPFVGMQSLVDPEHLIGPRVSYAQKAASLRFAALIGTAIVAGLYLLLVGAMHKSMVRNFDMTMRKQYGQ
jgi:ABC-type transport system involved in multi-copper enzyme maturation permease subunit